MKTAHQHTILAIAAAALLIPLTASGQILVSNPQWPTGVTPGGNVGYYLSGSVPSFTGGGVTITIDSALLRTLAPVGITPSGPNELGNVGADMNAIGDVIPLATDLPSFSSGNADILTLGKTGNVTGTFATEMLSLNLAGSSALGPFMFRESPTLASLGQTSITDVGGGLFRIDSFFDVFTEISIDGGQTWAPDANGPMRMSLVPEPGSALLTVLAGCAVLSRRRRHRQ